MEINKKLIGDIAEHIVGVRALNENILINKYKITRTKLEAIIAILIEINLVEYISEINQYKVENRTKEELLIYIQQAHIIIDRNSQEKVVKKIIKPVTNSITQNKNLHEEILNTLKKIEERLSALEQNHTQIRIPRKAKKR